MTNALVVARRELGQLFHSPLAYVFLIVFVFFVQFFSVLMLFKQGTADMQMFFTHLPWGIVLFAAFVTMRSWAEERQENTYEMLLTFPMRERDLVLGKFIAAFSFMCVGIAGTFTLPLILLVVGKPDVGAIVSGYVGAFLLAAMWCAGGVFISGLTRSQLLAVIVSAFFGIFSLILGTEVIASHTDSLWAGVGSFIEQMIGGWSHYASFSKGVVEASDAAYFLGWTVAFLWLNHLYIGLRRTPGSTAILAVGTPLALGCAMLVGRLTTGSSWARVDITADHLFTLSPGTVRIVSRAKTPIRVTFWVSRQGDMPKEYQSLERDVMDRLREIEVATAGKLVARVEYLDAKNAVEPQPEVGEEDPEKALQKAGKEETNVERRAMAKKVEPFMVRSLEATESSTKVVFATLEVKYGAKEEEMLQPIQPDRLPELEYMLASTVARLVRARAPKIALHLGAEPMDPQIKQFYVQQKRPLPDPFAHVEQLLRQEKFDVDRVALTAHEPMPDDYDALVVIGAADFDERQQWEVNRALVSGRPVFLAVQRSTWEYRQNPRGQVSAQRREWNSGLEPILEAQGLGVSPDVLLDENNVEIPMQTGSMMDNFGGTPLKVPTHMLVKVGTMNPDSIITQRLPTILYLWGAPVTTDDTKLARNGLAVTTLFSSGPHSWTVRPEAFKGFGPPKDGTWDPHPLAVVVKGQFQDAMKGRERPAWQVRMEDIMRNGRPSPAPPDPPATEVKPAPGQLILVGCAETWHQRFLQAGGAVSLLLNSLDALTLDEDLLLVRSKQPSDRRFDKQSADAVRFWSALPLGVVPLLIIGAGLTVGLLRLRRREAWEAEHAR